VALGNLQEEPSAGNPHARICEGESRMAELLDHPPIPAAALDSEAVQIGVQAVIDRRPRNFPELQDTKTLRLPGI